MMTCQVINNNCYLAFIIVSGFYIYIIMTKYNAEIIPGLKMVIPLLHTYILSFGLQGNQKR